MMDLVIELLDKTLHDREFFDCGITELNTFIKLQANQNQAKNISRTYVAVLPQEEKKLKTIYGYYTLSSGQINCDQLPIHLKAKLPKHPVPIARIGRLAINKNFHKRGIGGFLLYKAFINILAVGQKIGIFAVVVDAKDNNAQLFYKKYGFQELQNSSLTLFLPMNTIKLAATASTAFSPPSAIFSLSKRLEYS